MKEIQKSLDNLSKRGASKEPSLLERVLSLNPGNPKVAAILALDMFLVGIDTTSAAVSSTLYQLSKHKDKQDILHSEIKSALSGRPVTSESLEKLIYLKACIRETLRLYPVVIGNGRCLTKDTEICGYNIPPGTQVVFQHYVISNSERYFDQPKSFLPERWLKESNKSYHPFASLPFGFGKRMCLGRRFADLEMQTLIAKIILNYEVQYNYPDLTYAVHPMFMPSGPLKFTFKDRQHKS